MLVLSLTRRYHALAAQDPSRQVYSVQSPLYVGCSKHISNRWVEYDRLGNQTAYHSANKLMTLTMSLLWYRNLGAEVGKATVIRTWEAGQMKEAELLVAVVANAYSTQDGFNVVETGQTKDDGLANDAYKVSEQWEYVFSEMPHLADNLALSLDEIELAKKAEQVAQLERDLEAARTESEAESRRLQERVDDCILELEKQTPEIRAIATGIAKDRRLHQNASVVLRDIIKSAK
ncbi:hypothetical protein QBC41DRAFT_318877 [Cercophora samala]|uniref:Uncharacterized protein n=1 Tax=Cercophora samala TaxID=330535 RepID=A0AA39ZEZ6_9PEZI|nr:hypothetical protein QBC41DRAFT_318877 [Cercophora samala]